MKNAAEISHFSTRNLDSSTKDTSTRPPRGKRHGKGYKPTPWAERAIADKRRWTAARAAGDLHACADLGNAVAACEAFLNPHALALALPQLARIDVRALQLFARLVTLLLPGVFGVAPRSLACTHPALAKLNGTSAPAARRDMAQLCLAGVVRVVTPMFVRQGERCSYCGNAYTVPESVLDAVASSVGSRPAEFRQPSGTDSSLGVGRPSARAYSSEHECSMPAAIAVPVAEPASPGVVSAAPTVDFSMAAPAARIGAVGPVMRQDATRNAPPEAPEGEGFDAVWRELARNGDAFARELLEDLAYQRKQRAAGVTPAWELDRRRALSDRSDQLDRGGDA